MDYPRPYEAPRLTTYGTLAELTTPTAYFDDTDEDDPRHD